MSKLKYRCEHIFIRILVFVTHSDDVTDWGHLRLPVSADAPPPAPSPRILTMASPSLTQDGG